MGAGLFSILVLAVWWYIFHRWINLQRTYSYRAREIEDELDLRLNRYARILEYWESDTATDVGKLELKERDPPSYDRLQTFWKEQRKRHFGNLSIQWGLRLLTVIIALVWLTFILFNTIGYFCPRLLR